MAEHTYDYNSYTHRNTRAVPYPPGRNSAAPYPATGGTRRDRVWWNTPGPFTGRGPNGYTRSDDEIERVVCERLAANGLVDAREIQVSVKDCIVTLSGAVDSRESKRIVRDIADTVWGVEDVNNQLHIR